MSPSSSSPPPPPPGKGKETPIIIKKKGGGGHEGHHGGSWKVAYADFVTAMMALFLLLWLVASLRPDQKSALADVFQDKKPPTQGQAEQIPFMPKNARPGVPELKLNTDEQVKVNVALMIKELISKNPTLVKNTGISTDEYGVILNVNNNIMFETNSAVMRPEAKQVIDDVVEVLKKHKINLDIRGHTDEGETGGSLYPSKWELSAARAAAAVKAVLDEGKGDILPVRLQATGYADSRPLVPETTQGGGADANRRVEFYYHSPELSEKKSL